MARQKTTDRAIAEACKRMERALDAPHPVGVLATACGMAEHHFQRRFAAATGETVAGYLRSRRMERAATELAQTSRRIIDIALDCGFDGHAAFTRAFSAHFGLSPASFRTNGLPTESQGVAPRPYLRPRPSSTTETHLDLVETEAQAYCWRSATGMKDGRFFPDLDRIAAEFSALFAALGPREAVPLTVYRQGPRSFEDPNATAQYGALLDTAPELNWPEGWGMLPAGRYAVFAHHGPLTLLHLSWHRAARVALPAAGLRWAGTPMFETYLTGMSQTDPDALTALIHLPVLKA